MNEPSEPEQRSVAARRTLARQRLDIAVNMRCKGRTLGQIAAKLGISKQAVSKALIKADARALARLDKRIALMKIRQAGQIEQLVCEAYSAWERSKRPTRKRKTTTDPQGLKTRTDESIGSTGDPRYLQTIVALLASERALWGLDADTPHDGESLPLARMVEEIRSEHFAGLSDDQRRRRLEFSARAIEQQRRDLEAEQARLAEQIGGEA